MSKILPTALLFFLATAASTSADVLVQKRVEADDYTAPVVVETLPAERWARTVANGMGRRYRVVLDRAPTVPSERARALRAVFELDHALAKLSNGGPSPLDSTVSGQSADAAAPVRWLLARQEPETDIRYGERVVEIDTDAAAPPGGYAPPEGYEEIPFEPGTLWTPRKSLGRSGEPPAPQRSAPGRLTQLRVFARKPS